MGSRRRSPRTDSLGGVTSQAEMFQSICASDFLRNSEANVNIRKRKEEGGVASRDGGELEGDGGRREDDHAKCTSSTKSHNSRNYFSLANGLILILILLLCWTTTYVHGGFPGRGPPSHPRGPPLLPHHPLAGNPFSRRRPPHPHHHGPPPRGRLPHPPHPQHGKHHHHRPGGDLNVAAQTHLYDLRGYQFPHSGPENPRFHRQNDPFTLPTHLAPNPRAQGGAPTHISQDTRTAPLVFPSFYQEQPTPTPTRATIFGHNQHLSQTRFEPPSGFHLGGNSASGKITLEQQSASSRDQFRPSQIDISLHGNQVTPSPSPFGPQAQTSTLAPQAKSLTSTNRPRATVKLNKNQQQDPFVYVYDEVDYDEGDDDFVLGGRQRTPQGQINSNRITPSTSTTTVAPLRSREPTIVPNQFPTLQYHQPQQHHQALFTSTTTPPPQTTQNSLYYSNQKDDFQNNYRDTSDLIRPPVTPRPNVEIVPSSERKPPPDQSNAISPVFHRFPQSTIRDFGRQPQQQQLPLVSEIIDLRRRPPTTTTTTTITPPPAHNVAPFQSQAYFPALQQNNQQPQGRQVSPSPPTQIPYFPPGLDRRPFETTNDIPSIQTKNQFDQVVNLLQEEDEEYSQNNNLQNGGQNLHEQGFNNPSKLRPVNTLVPKNRIPKEDFILGPNFPFTHAQDVTTPLSPVAPERVRDGTQQRIRDQTTRIRDSLPRTPPTQPQVRTRPPLRLQDDQEDEIDDNVINQHHSQVSPPPSPPARARGRQPRARTTTPAPASQDAPQRTRTASPRQRLRPNYRQSTTTTSSTTTTPVPTYVEYPSQEYLDDYDNQQYQQSPAPPAQVLSPVVPQQQQQPISRFPPFPNKNKQATEVSTVPPNPLQRQRPTLAGQRQRPGKGNRFRDTTTDSTSPRTTGKPLYTTGKMLAKEGGLYAGQMITSSHVYGNPVPNIPINSVLDKMPGVLDGNSVFIATTKPSNFGSPQKQLRSKQRFPDHGPPSRINQSSHRLRPAARPSNENGLDIVETVTLRPYSESKEEQPKRLRAGNQFVRGSSQQQSTERSQEDGQAILPRRRKKPRQRRPLQQQDPYTETVSIHSSTRATEDEDVSSFQTERAQILRESPIETTTPNSIIPSPRSRRPRPRPGKFNQVNSADLSNVSERSREQREEEQPEEPKPLKPIRKLRPRLRPVPVGQLNAQQQRGSPSEVVPQSQSAQVERKPTDAPGRFSSRFRDEENVDVSTVSTLRGDDRETSSTGPSRFSPPTSRLTFKPPPPKKNGPRQRNQNQNSKEGERDAIPDSIKLSPKDVIANRKPARRIPPGSVSDRLKALQQRRNKVFGQQQQQEEQTAEGRQVPITKRPRLKPVLKVQQQQQPDQDQEDRLPQPQRLRRPQSSQEQTGSKRAILPASGQQRGKVRNEVDYYNEENEQTRDDFEEEENEDYQNEEEKFTSPAPSPKSQFIASVTGRPGRNNGGFHRNRSAEVTSDEARSVLGIQRPAAPNRAPNGKRLRFQKKYQYEDEEQVEEEEEPQQQQQQLQVQERPRLQNNPPRLKFRQNKNSNNDRSQQRGEEDDREIQTVVPERQQSRKVSRERVRRPSQERFREEEPEEEEDYRDVEDDQEERAQPPRKVHMKPKLRYQNQNPNSPASFQKVFCNKKLKTEQGGGNRSRQQIDAEEEELGEEEQQQSPQDEQEQDEEEDITPSSERTTTTSTSTTSTSSTSTSTSTSSQSPLTEDEELPPVALPVRTGPQPIKQNMLKARLRPNRRLQKQSQQQPPRISVSATTTQATITEETTTSNKQPGLKHTTIHVNKSPRPRLNSRERGGGGGGGGKRNSKKFIAMATENPSLPLESIFPEV